VAASASTKSAPARSVLRLDRVAPTETLVSFPLPVTLDATRADLARLDPSTLRFRVEPARSPAWLVFEQAAHRDTVIRYGPVE
jgi:hypothetical protein